MQNLDNFASTIVAADAARVREMAARLDVLPEDDFALLAGTKQSTLEAWRKRGTGPAYVLLGNRYFYPVESVQEYLRARVKERPNTAAGVL